MNLLTDGLIIAGVEKKLAEIAGSLPPGVEIVAGYNRSGLIETSIGTLRRALIEEAITVSLVMSSSYFISARLSFRY